MMDPTEFDAFYRAARQRLLHQTYALTGDQRAAQLAVRDSFIAAWHHWHKVSRLEDPERWVRPHAWTHALRRHSTRIWHREKGTDPDTAATLEALAKLPVTQRKMLLLAHLTAGSMEELAQEVGLPREDAERVLQAATATFSTDRAIDSTAIRPALEALTTSVTESSWPRDTIIRRAGTARRRTTTLIGVGAAVAALVGSGVAVYADDGVRPRLTHQAASAKPSPSPAAPTPPPVELSEDHLLAATQLGRLGSGLRWRVTDTTTNTEGKGLVLPCQTARFADPDSAGYLVRSFRGSSRKASATAGGAEPPSAFETTELSPDQKAAQASYAATRAWFAGCDEPSVHLVTTSRVDGVGDDATLFVLHQWARRTSLVVGVARTGRVVTTTVAPMPSPAPDLGPGSTLLAAAVNSLCGAAGTGHCAGPPRLTAIDPLPTGTVPGMLSAVDLPPVSGVSDSWAGTEPRKALGNTAATQCDQTVFTSPPMSVALTRTFLFPHTDLPDTFGLAQTVGTLREPRAADFVATVRKRLAGCEEKQLGTTVFRLAERDDTGRGPDTQLSAWRLEVEVTDKSTVTYYMGIARHGTAVGQVGFITAPGATVTSADFVDLMVRAQQRLAQMPPPKRR